MSDVVDILNGFAFQAAEYASEGIRIIRISNVQKGQIVDADPKFYPASYQSSLGRYLLEEGDLLMSLTGNVGRVGQMPNDLLPAGLNQRVACLRMIDDRILNRRFLFHLLDGGDFELHCEQAAFGSAQANLSTEWLKTHKIPLPPIEVQLEIVKTLDFFHTLPNDLKVGLPAEIEARRKQYEYYRNWLLTFQELDAA